MAPRKNGQSPGRKKGQRYFKTVRSVRAYVGRLMLAMEDHCKGVPTPDMPELDTDAARCMGFLAKTMADIITKTALEERIETLERKAMQPISTMQQPAAPH